VTYVNAALRHTVIERAGKCCEYCQVSQEDRVMPYEVDHIIAEKHGGSTTKGAISARLIGMAQAS
jgi:hypothetical protein